MKNGRLLCLFHDRLRQDGWQLQELIDPDDGSATYTCRGPRANSRGASRWFDEQFSRIRDG